MSEKLNRGAQKRHLGLLAEVKKYLKIEKIKVPGSALWHAKCPACDGDFLLDTFMNSYNCFHCHINGDLESFKKIAEYAEWKKINV